MTISICDLVVIILCSYCIGVACVCATWIHSIEKENQALANKKNKQ